MAGALVFILGIIVFPFLLTVGNIINILNDKAGTIIPTHKDRKYILGKFAHKP
jgi:hypothetical protein